MGVSFLHHSDSRHDLPWCAEAALEAVMREKRRLHGMELLALRKAFDRRDMLSFVHDRQSKAGENPPPVDMHGAGAALSMVAAFFVPVSCACSRIASSSDTRISNFIG